jgi:hypothetical protein
MLWFGVCAAVQPPVALPPQRSMIPPVPTFAPPVPQPAPVAAIPPPVMVAIVCVVLRLSDERNVVRVMPTATTAHDWADDGHRVVVATCSTSCHAGSNSCPIIPCCFVTFPRVLVVVFHSCRHSQGLHPCLWYLYLAHLRCLRRLGFRRLPLPSHRQPTHSSALVMRKLSFPRQNGQPSSRYACIVLPCGSLRLSDVVPSPPRLCCVETEFHSIRGPVPFG